MTEQQYISPEWPDSQIRFNFPFEDYKTISGHWTSWDETTRAQFADLVASTRPSDLLVAVDRFLSAPAASPENTSSQDTDGKPPAAPDAGTSTGASSDSLDSSPVTTPATDSTDSTDSTTDPSVAGESGGSITVSSDAELHAALRTGAPAEVWAEAHHADVARMIELESGEEGKGRKTVLAELRRLAHEQQQDQPGQD